MRLPYNGGGCAGDSARYTGQAEIILFIWVEVWQGRDTGVFLNQ
jgi:hypothetical protein